ncbi:Pol polyprotein [Elysia marginata]|uniref:Pol polyprotein n=1 Tax=Elysia marginata TaxID=1093978 RepID=A0AAV4FEC3_9GAST|nr:Pol polyprotein [Elysia marginata]
MLLGVDYLDKHGVEINFEDHTLKVHGIRLPLQRQSDQVQAKAYLEQETFVPAMSAVQARCVLESPLSGEILLSPERHPVIVTPWTLCSGYDNVYFLVCNWSNRDVHLPRGRTRKKSCLGELKKALTTTPVLGIPTSTDRFILNTDASDYPVGAELSQVQNGQEKVIGYGSYTLSKEQRRYCTTRKELLAVVKFTRQFRPYLLGRRFTVRTDE